MRSVTDRCRLDQVSTFAGKDRCRKTALFTANIQFHINVPFTRIFPRKAQLRLNDASETAAVHQVSDFRHLVLEYHGVQP